jgi:transposase-like protein
LPVTVTGKRNPERKKYFVEQYVKWRESGLTQAAFCRDKGINTNTFNCWKLAIERKEVDIEETEGKSKAVDRRAGKSARMRAKSGVKKSEAFAFRRVSVQEKSMEPIGTLSVAANKQEFWKQMVRLYLESSLPPAEFCKQHGVSRSTLFYWKSKIAPSNYARNWASEETPPAAATERAETISPTPITTVPARKVVAEVFHEPSTTTLRIFAEDHLEIISVVLRAFLAR